MGDAGDGVCARTTTSVGAAVLPFMNTGLRRGLGPTVSTPDLALMVGIAVC
jgi:hypothetical protein